MTSLTVPHIHNIKAGRIFHKLQCRYCPQHKYTPNPVVWPSPPKSTPPPPPVPTNLVNAYKLLVWVGGVRWSKASRGVSAICASHIFGDTQDRVTAGFRIMIWSYLWQQWCMLILTSSRVTVQFKAEHECTRG
jgi:hypothetical protein